MELPDSIPLLDVRAPIEFQQGHIPSAINFPLFDNEEREKIGTAYKVQGREKAILLGLELIGPKMRLLVERAIKLAKTSHHGKRQVRIHCWRGGMRSQSIAWLLEQADFQVELLDGGYKSYRRYARSWFERQFSFVVLSGLTGAGKTRLLHRLANEGEQVLDLEGLANHRGSAFGGIGQGAQPTTEQFENLVATRLKSLDPNRRIWVEDESKKVGRAVIPDSLFNQINGGPGIFMEVTREERARILTEDYGELEVDEMVAAIHRIKKKLGGQNVNAAVEAIEAGDKQTCCQILLDYYDRLYLVANARGLRETSHSVTVEHPDSPEATYQVIKAADQAYPATAAAAH